MDDCEVGAGKKACKNCTCGRADAEAAVQKVDLSQDMLENPQSACGSVGLLNLQFVCAKQHSSRAAPAAYNHCCLCTIVPLALSCKQTAVVMYERSRLTLAPPVVALSCRSICFKLNGAEGLHCLSCSVAWVMPSDAPPAHTEACHPLKWARK